MPRGQGEAPSRIGTGRFQGFGADYHIVHSFHEQPGRGAEQFSYDTLALPLYTTGGMGWGVATRRSWQHAPSAPPMYSRQGATIQNIGSPGILSGQFMSGPLINTQANPAAGLGTFANRPGQYMLPRGTA